MDLFIRRTLRHARAHACRCFGSPSLGFGAAPTLRLLRAIADSPATHPNGEPGKKPRVHNKVSVLKCKAESCADPTRGRREKDAKAAAVAKPARKEEQRVGQTPGTRKRPRPSPGSADATKGRRNPVIAYRLPSPSPRSSRASRNGTNERCAKSSRRESVFDTPEYNDEDIDFTALRKSGGRVRGSPKMPKQGDGGVSSPYTLVDLSGIEDGESTGVGTEEGGEPAKQGLLESFSMVPSEASLSQSCGQSRGGGDTFRGDDKTLSPSFSPGCDRGHLSERGDEEEEQGENEDAEGREIDSQNQEGTEILLANKLSFLVSSNTGRVHVYQEQDNDGDCLDDFFEEEDRRPLHCRLVVSTLARL